MNGITLALLILWAFLCFSSYQTYKKMKQPFYDDDFEEIQEAKLIADAIHKKIK